MFVRLKTVQAPGRTYQYVQVVESRWEHGRSRQRVVGNLGRLDELLASGSLERMVASLAKHCPGVRVLDAQRRGALEVESDRTWGPVLVFDRLWEELGLQGLLRDVGRRRKLAFDFERMVFAQVLQRLCEPGSDLRGSKWIDTVHEPSFAPLQLRHFYRCLAPLWSAKTRIERALYERGLDLFNQTLDLVFFDTTSTYFEGTSLDGWAKRGKSKDHRPDHLQLVVGAVIRQDGTPITCEIWPGNTADVTTLVPVVQGLQGRFRIEKVVIVCDRGMVSAANLAAITAAGYEYIVGMKMRRQVEVRDDVLGRAGRYQEVAENLRVKEVWVEDRRYVICENPEEAAKDRADREAILAKLRQKLAAGGVKALIANRGYKRFLRVRGMAAEIDAQVIAAEARYDGRYILRTTTSLPAAAVALAYKQLCWIERLWRDLKDVMEVRPIFHHLKKDNVRGHIFVCFLALYLAAELKRRLKTAQLALPWDDVIRDLTAVRAIAASVGGERHLMRSPLTGCAGKVLAAVGVKAPPVAQALAPPP
jgi:hypothetical protein